jgi:hypothetical protein
MSPRLTNLPLETNAGKRNENGGKDSIILRRNQMLGRECCDAAIQCRFTLADRGLSLPVSFHMHQTSWCRLGWSCHPRGTRAWPRQRLSLDLDLPIDLVR